jgi:hypothetical protein
MQYLKNSYDNELNDITSLRLDNNTELSDLPKTLKGYLADRMLPTAPLSYYLSRLELTTLTHVLPYLQAYCKIPPHLHNETRTSVYLQLSKRM